MSYHTNRSFDGRVSMGFAVTMLFAGMTACHTFAGDAWPRFRGPDGNGVATADAAVPLRWSPDQNIAFRTPLPGEGWSSPVVAGGRVYLSAAIAGDERSDSEPSNFQLSLLIVDATSGELIKIAPLLEQDAKTSPRIHKKNSHASPTPIVRGDRVYVHFGFQGTVCTDLEGKVIWKNRDLFFQPVHGNGGTPILVDDHLIFTCDGASDPKVVALRADDGKVAWEVERPNEAKRKFSFCTPTLITVDGRKQVIAPGSDCVLAIDPDDGSVIWKLLYSGYSVIPKPIFHRGLIFLSTSYDSASMLAIDPTGTGDVTQTHLKWSIDNYVPHTPSMIADQGLIYSVSDNGIAMCVDAETGEMVYKKRVGGGFSASPILVGDRIYLTNESGLTTVLQTGRQYQELAENDLAERTLASIAVDGNALIIRTSEALYRIEK